ncbi:hypothetical protein IWZ01DRAFT_567035, partial [Phyllosticta capitalensis]
AILWNEAALTYLSSVFFSAIFSNTSLPCSRSIACRKVVPLTVSKSPECAIGGPIWQLNPLCDLLYHPSKRNRTTSIIVIATSTNLPEILSPRLHSLHCVDQWARHSNAWHSPYLAGNRGMIGTAVVNHKARVIYAVDPLVGKKLHDNVVRWEILVDHQLRRRAGRRHQVHGGSPLVVSRQLLLERAVGPLVNLVRLKEQRMSPLRHGAIAVPFHVAVIRAGPPSKVFGAIAVAFETNGVSADAILPLQRLARVPLVEAVVGFHMLISPDGIRLVIVVGVRVQTGVQEAQHLVHEPVLPRSVVLFKVAQVREAVTREQLAQNTVRLAQAHRRLGQPESVAHVGVKLA